MTRAELNQLLNAIVDHSILTATDYLELVPETHRRLAIQTQPIPYFGNILVPEVKFFTIGVNPSASEFYNRQWPLGGFTPEELCGRLLGYFDPQQVPTYHPWFNGWNTALVPLGIQYGSNLAHLDLSYRATKSMGALNGPNRVHFEDMVVGDSQFFFQLLGLLLPQTRGLIMAGTVGRFYMDCFFNRLADAGHAGFHLNYVRTLDFGPLARVEFFQLTWGQWTVPVLFCSSSPSDRRRPELLRERIVRLADEIRQIGFSGQ